MEMDIQLDGMGINSHHGNIVVEDHQVWLDPLLKSNGDFICLNGVNVYQRVQLEDGDRLIIGLNHVYLVCLEENKKK